MISVSVVTVSRYGSEEALEKYVPRLTTLENLRMRRMHWCA